MMTTQPPRPLTWKPKPVAETDAERVKELSASVRRHIAAIVKIADELDRIAARCEQDDQQAA